MTPDPSKLATTIVAMYPRAWRARYADEMLALIVDRGVAWRDVMDLAWGCCSEWRVSLADPDEHFVACGFEIEAARGTLRRSGSGWPSEAGPEVQE